MSAPVRPSQSFYDVDEVYPFLRNLFAPHFQGLIEELQAVSAQPWHDWPEKNLYGEIKEWKVFPFFGFGVWAEEYCRRCPLTVELLKKIPGLRTALYSRLGPHSKIQPHKGWGVLSNEILRCHLGLLVPENSGIWVEEESMDQKLGDWIVFDDSRSHYGFNFSNGHKVALLIDIERPSWIAKGTSDVQVSMELTDLVNSFTKIL